MSLCAKWGNKMSVRSYFLLSSPLCSTGKKKQMSTCHLQLSAFFLRSIKVTPRASLSNPSHCLVISSCSKHVLAPCETTANIGIAFPNHLTFSEMSARWARVLTVGLHRLEREDIVYLCNLMWMRFGCSRRVFLLS